jgi:hypothetical protein
VLIIGPPHAAAKMVGLHYIAISEYPSEPAAKECKIIRRYRKALPRNSLRRGLKIPSDDAELRKLG